MNELHDLLDRIDMPVVDLNDDVARGERALRERRRWQVSGVTAAAATLVALAGVVQVGGSGRSAAPEFADTSTALPTPDPSGNQGQRGPGAFAVMRGYRDVLAEHLDPGGDQLGRITGVGGGSFEQVQKYDHLESKLTWRRGGMLMITVSTSWSTSYWTADEMGGRKLQYHGHAARMIVDGEDISVAVEHEDGQVVELDASPVFENMGTSIAATGLTARQLLAAAADPRLHLPDDVR